MRKNPFVYLPAVIAVVLLFIQPHVCIAMHASDGPEIQIGAGTNLAINLRGSVGLLNGEARELVYDFESGRRRKASELIWDLKSLYMIGGVVSANICNWFNVNLGIWTAVNEGNGNMVDYDWVLDTPNAPSPNDWTDRSFSDVKVTEATVFDLNASIIMFNWQDIVFRGIIGFKQDSWEWEDSGQDYVYSSLSFRDTTGSFEGQNVINYDQTFTVPYLGISANGPLGPVNIGVYLLYSSAVSAEDNDFHVLRGIHFTEKFSSGDYIAMGINTTYHISDQLFVSGAIDYQSIPEINGDMELTDPNGETQSYSNTAGIQHNSTMFSVSIGCKF
ncbi:MAG: omptin family outer membrane protease [Kiritimatiellae bacterium]|nr:omptin family outer membrane protease [Kiritimatiellia bacterium]MDD5523033.1 omptin family outer membrane protease [Kiritimatiellia bacterium]